MKKQMALLLALAMVLALMTGCGRVAGQEIGTGASSAGGEKTQQGGSSTVGAEQPEGPAASEGLPGEETPWLTVDNTAAYDAAYAFTAEEDGLYRFETVYGGEAAGPQALWDVYVLEDAFDEGTRYIPQSYEPCLSGEAGTLSLKAGSWVYCFCSVNAFTGDKLPEGSCVLQVYQSVQPVESGAFSKLVSEGEPETPETPETPDTPDAPETPDTPEDGGAITSEAAFEGAYSFVVRQTGMYTFTIDNAEGHEDVTWDIYVLEEPFEEAVRYIPQAETPALCGEGGVALTEGQVVYCFCSMSSFTNTLEEVSGASTLRYTISQKLR